MTIWGRLVSGTDSNPPVRQKPGLVGQFCGLVCVLLMIPFGVLALWFVTVGEWIAVAIFAGLSALLASFVFAIDNAQPRLPTHGVASGTMRVMLLALHGQLVGALTRYHAPELDALRLTFEKLHDSAYRHHDTTMRLLMSDMIDVITAAQSGHEADAVAMLPELEARINALPD